MHFWEYTQISFLFVQIYFCMDPPCQFGPISERKLRNLSAWSCSRLTGWSRIGALDTAQSYWLGALVYHLCRFHSLRRWASARIRQIFRPRVGWCSPAGSRRVCRICVWSRAEGVRCTSARCTSPESHHARWLRSVKCRSMSFWPQSLSLLICLLVS